MGVLRASEIHITGCVHNRVGKLRRTNEVQAILVSTFRLRWVPIMWPVWLPTAD